MALCEKCGEELNENSVCENCEKKTVESKEKSVGFFTNIKHNLIMMLETPKALTVLCVLMVVGVFACVFFGNQIEVLKNTTVANSNMLFFVMWIMLSVLIAVCLVFSVIFNIKRKNIEKMDKK